MSLNSASNIISDMKKGLKADKEAIKAKIENCIKNAQIEKAFNFLEKNIEFFSTSKEDIHLARANYVKAEKDNELGLSDREELSKVRSRTIRFIQRIIGQKRKSGVVKKVRFWIIVLPVILIMSLIYLGKEYIFVENNNQIENTTLNKENLEEYFRKLKDQTVEITEKNELIDEILYNYGGSDFNVEIRGANDNLVDKQKLSDILKQLKFGDYEGYVIKGIDSKTIIIKRVN